MRPAANATVISPAETSARSTRVLIASPAAIRSVHRSPLLVIPVYWHLLSLDAPTVAALWAWSFARVSHVSASTVTLAILAIGTWLFYVGDRILDARPSAARLDLRERHFFHRRHWRALMMVSAAASLPLLWLIFFRMHTAARRDDALLFAGSMLYFAIVHLRWLRIGGWLLRELAVGLIFACATAVPVWSHPGSHHAELVLPILLFASLCWLNIVAIHVWERRASSANGSPVSTMACSVAAVAIALALSAGARHSSIQPLCIAVALSAFLLRLLDSLHRRTAWLSTLGLRIAADAALLTPLLLLLPWRP